MKKKIMEKLLKLLEAALFRFKNLSVEEKKID